MGRTRKWKFIFLATLIPAGLVGCVLSTAQGTGALAQGERLARMQSSSQWDKIQERFTNVLPRVRLSSFEATWDFFFAGSATREPETPPKVTQRRAEDFSELPTSGLRVTWFGHSTMLLELDGTRTLIDPIWSERASPFTWAGPKRFYEPLIALQDLPPLDAVVISHDHYDHLDSETVKDLAARVPLWFVPLGVGAHLNEWGIPSTKIVELDWWESHPLGDVTITATPSRHFSGRSVTFGDQNATLWAGWAWTGPTRRAFYSGDTALHQEFSTIGEKLGPFDVTMIESGAYNQSWADVHLGPEQAVLAHQLVQGKVMLPVHWGLFNLALHGWTEPAERILVAAQKLGVDALFLDPGASFDIANAPSISRWWPDLPWQTVEEAPAWSSSVENLQAPLRE